MRSLALLTVVTVFSPAGWAADWPCFLGPDHTGRAPDTGINQDWQAHRPAQLWLFQMHDGDFAGPAVAGSKRFIVDPQDGNDVVCVDRRKP
jgi:outer membrane protein assembly factor BamB